MNNLPDGVTQRQIDEHMECRCLCSRCKREFDFGDGGFSTPFADYCEPCSPDVVMEAAEGEADWLRRMNEPTGDADRIQHERNINTLKSYVEFYG